MKLNDVFDFAKNELEMNRLGKPSMRQRNGIVKEMRQYIRRDISLSLIPLLLFESIALIIFLIAMAQLDQPVEIYLIALFIVGVLIIAGVKDILQREGIIYLARKYQQLNGVPFEVLRHSVNKTDFKLIDIPNDNSWYQYELNGVVLEIRQLQFDALDDSKEYIFYYCKDDKLTYILSVE